MVSFICSLWLVSSPQLYMTQWNATPQRFNWKYAAVFPSVAFTRTARNILLVHKTVNLIKNLTRYGEASHCLTGVRIWWMTCLKILPERGIHPYAVPISSRGIYHPPGWMGAARADIIKNISSDRTGIQNFVYNKRPLWRDDLCFDAAAKIHKEYNRADTGYFRWIILWIAAIHPSVVGWARNQNGAPVPSAMCSFLSCSVLLDCK